MHFAKLSVNEPLLLYFCCFWWYQT